MASPQSSSKLSAPIDLARVRELFARPARVAPSDFLRREVAERMHERLSLVKLVPKQVLDAGCGKRPIRRPRSWAWTGPRRWRARPTSRRRQPAR
jgi:hypothetical protein